MHGILAGEEEGTPGGKGHIVERHAPVLTLRTYLLQAAQHRGGPFLQGQRLIEEAGGVAGVVPFVDQGAPESLVVKTVGSRVVPEAVQPQQEAGHTRPGAIYQRVPRIPEALKTLLHGRVAACNGMPGALRPPRQGEPVVVKKVLPVIIPCGVEHACRPEGITVTHEMRDIHPGTAQVGEDAVPAAHPRTYPVLQRVLRKRFDVVAKRRGGMVGPRQHDDAVGQEGDDRRIFFGDVAPHHGTLAVFLQDSCDAIDVIGIDAGQPHGVDHRLCRAAAQAEHLVAVDDKEFAVIRPGDLAEDILQQLVTLLKSGGDHPGGLGQVTVFRFFQDMTEMAEGLEVAHQLDVIFLRILRQLTDLLSSDTVGRGDAGMRL